MRTLLLHHRSRDPKLVHAPPQRRHVLHDGDLVERGLLRGSITRGDHGETTSLARMQDEMRVFPVDQVKRRPEVGRMGEFDAQPHGGPADPEVADGMVTQQDFEAGADPAQGIVDRRPGIDLEEEIDAAPEIEALGHGLESQRTQPARRFGHEVRGDRVVFPEDLLEEHERLMLDGFLGKDEQDVIPLDPGTLRGQVVCKEVALDPGQDRRRHDRGADPGHVERGSLRIEVRQCEERRHECDHDDQNVFPQGIAVHGFGLFTRAPARRDPFRRLSGSPWDRRRRRLAAAR